MIAELLSSVASILALSSSFPETLQVLKTRHTSDLSLIFLIMAVAGQIAWVVYSIYVWNIVFIFGEGFDMVMWSTILVIAIWNYKKHRAMAEKK